MADEVSKTVHFEPIGYVRSGKSLKFQTPHQPDRTSSDESLVVLEPGRQFDLALQDLEGFDRIWLVSWFDRNKNWRPRPLPPRGPAKRRGVFATRSPHRPNPIGLTCVPLLGVDGLTLRVGPLDLVDGTPILDIKPYLRTVDAFPEASLGWVGEIEEELASEERYVIQVSEAGEEQLSWLRDEWSIDFTERAFGILSLNPRPHRTRRILEVEDGLFRMACGPWRLYYRIDGMTVRVESVAKGYSDETLLSKGYEGITDRDAQLAFAQKFG